MAEAITNVDKSDAPDFEPPEGFKVLNCTITEDELPFRERSAPRVYCRCTLS